jgi:hypothetical protein
MKESAQLISLQIMHPHQKQQTEATPKSKKIFIKNTPSVDVKPQSVMSPTSVTTVSQVLLPQSTPNPGLVVRLQNYG